MCHIKNWWKFVGNIGAAISAAAVIDCLVLGEFAPLHGIMMVSGPGILGLGYWLECQREAPIDRPDPDRRFRG